MLSNLFLTTFLKSCGKGAANTIYWYFGQFFYETLFKNLPVKRKTTSQQEDGERDRRTPLLLLYRIIEMVNARKWAGRPVGKNQTHFVYT